MNGVDIVYPLPGQAALAQLSGVEFGYAITIQKEGTLTKLVVAQLTGNLDGFTWTLYNSIKACPPGLNPSAAATQPEILYRVCGPVVVAATNASFTPGGTDLESWPNDGVFGCFIPYQNIDNKILVNGVQPQRVDALYLKLSVAAGTGPKTFGYAFTSCMWDI